jgi:hypothetical protein
MASAQADDSYEADIDRKVATEAGTYNLPDSSSDKTSLSEGKTFLTAGLKDAYVPIDKYEGRHRWDPDFQWTEEEERKIVRRVRIPIGWYYFHH